jgi:hypothetical protein
MVADWRTAMRRITKLRLTKALSPDELNQLVSWFAESYDQGWRPPSAWSPAEMGALRAKVAELEEQQRVDDGDVPWV